MSRPQQATTVTTLEHHSPFFFFQFSKATSAPLVDMQRGGVEFQRSSNSCALRIMVRRGIGRSFVHPCFDAIALPGRDRKLSYLSEFANWIFAAKVFDPSRRVPCPTRLQFLTAQLGPPPTRHKV
jgi:hypothetical protein